jgi:FkbM family methyltransferase
MAKKLERFTQFLKVISYITGKSSTYKEYISFAQAGEDRVLKFLFMSMGLNKISYLEIGTNNPVEINNTYFFYVGGSRGVCVEPNPTLIPRIKKVRPEDVCLNVGVSPDNTEGDLDFYIFDDSDSEKGLSTFSKAEAEHVQNVSHIKIGEVKKIPVIPITKILEKYFPHKAPDLISIDVEGLDLQILQTIDFKVCRPVAICVETVDFTVSHKKTKNTEIIKFMESQGYFVYADTGLNSIFADKSLF